MSETVIPFCDLNAINKNCIAEIKNAVEAVIDRHYFILGPETSAFEKEYCEYTGAKFCITLANGTDALEIALRSLEVGAGDNVIIAPNAGGYGMTAINNIGANSVFVDVNESNLTLDIAKIPAAVLKNAKVMIVTHLYGNTADMESILKVTSQYGIKVIEDCAQSHGAKINGKQAGTLGDIGCFSFYPTKNLGAFGDAGALVTNNESIAEKALMIRQYGWKTKYHSAAITGRNSRIDEFQAAILRIKLRQLDFQNKQREELAQYYHEKLKSLPLIFQVPPGQASVYHLYVVRTEQRTNLQQYLTGQNVQAMIHYPVPDYRQLNSRAKAINYEELANTEKACSTVLSLPFYPNQPEKHLEITCRKIQEFFESH